MIHQIRRLVLSYHVFGLGFQKQLSKYTGKVQQAFTTYQTIPPAADRYYSRLTGL